MEVVLQDIMGDAGAAGFAGAAIAVAAAGFLRGFVGFGAALVAVPILSLVYTPAIAAPIAFLSGLPTVLQLLPSAVRDSERAFVLPIAGAAFLAAPIGTWALAVTEPQLMRMAIAILVLAMILLMQTGWRVSGRPSRTLLVGAGLVAGAIQGAAGVGGPPAVAVALSRGGGPTAQRANVIAAVTALALSTALPLWAFGLFTAEALRLGAVFVPIHFFAAILGARYFHVGGQRHYRVAAMGTLAAVGVFTFAMALRSYLTR